ncbi:hypothetical protein DL98DRAFT_591473 [Cadophora sp. DSE1049]|nr:hypothetical protein DL98DRAFT_591473 [Cadophora sp. DSE1049]
MYALWFKKPLNVQRPTRIDLELDYGLELLAFGVQMLIEYGYGSLRDSLDLSPPLRHAFVFQYPTIETSNYYHTPIAMSQGELPLEVTQPRFAYYKVLDPVKSLGNKYRIDSDRIANSVPILTHTNLMRPDDTGALQYEFPRPTGAWFTPAGGQETVCTLLLGQNLDCGIGPDFMMNHGSHTTYGTPIAVSLSQRDVNRLQLASKFVRRIDFRGPSIHTYDRAIYETKCATNCPPFDLHDLRSLDYPSSLSSFCHRAVNSEWVVLYALSRSMQGNNLYLAPAIPAIPAAYGCVHLGALSVIFPTAVEKLVWRASCFYLIGAAALSALVLFFFYLDKLAKHLLGSQIIRLFPAARARAGGIQWPTKQELEDVRSRLTQSQRKGYFYVKFCMWAVGQHNFGIYPSPPLAAAILRSKAGNFLLGHQFYSLRRRVLTICIKAIGISLMTIYIAARIYLVIESFISFRHVPIGVYKSPPLNFFGNIPHL